MDGMSRESASLLWISLLSVAMMVALAWLPRAANLRGGLLALRDGQVDARSQDRPEERGGHR